MKVKKNVKAPKNLRSRKGKYKELWTAIEEMPIDSWIEVRFDEPIALRHRNAVYAAPANTFAVRMSVYIIDMYTMKVGKLPAKEK